MNRWSSWHDSLPEHTKSWLAKQPLWYDRDLALIFAVGVVVGLLIGVTV